MLWHRDVRTRLYSYNFLTGEEQASEDENHCPNVRLKVDTNHALEEVELDSETELMKSMGLPLQFGGQSAHRDFVVKLYLLYLFCLCCVSRPRDVPPLSYF